jgi:hypothetical protein
MTKLVSTLEGVVAFPLESIQGKPAPAGTTRIERGFIGSHSDIGGGYSQGDLSKVALEWMINQATAAGVQMKPLQNPNIIATPVIHDKSSNLVASTGPSPNADSEDRAVNYADGSSTQQRKANNFTMNYAETQQFISYKANPNAGDNISGTVDMKGYLQWLNKNGYEINLIVH